MTELPSYIEEVAVLSSHQRRGIGSDLVVKVAARLHEQGHESVSILPLNHSVWVERLGFVPHYGGGFIASCSLFAGR
jgi:predicted N-acetyltransferase YhbS